MLHLTRPLHRTSLIIVPANQPVQANEDSPINALSAVSNALPSPVLLATVRVALRQDAYKPLEPC